MCSIVGGTVVHGLSQIGYPAPVESARKSCSAKSDTSTNFKSQTDWKQYALAEVIMQMAFLLKLCHIHGGFKPDAHLQLCQSTFVMSCKQQQQQPA